MHAFEYLASDAAVQPVLVLAGDDRFLKRLVRDRIGQLLDPDGRDDVSTVVLDGDTVGWADLSDQLATRSLFGVQRRLIVVEQAGELITRQRARLEDYVARPSRASVLVLDVRTWPGNTRLYKLVEQHGLAVQCDPPQRPVGKRTEVDLARLAQWLAQRCSEVHRAELSRQAALRLLEISEHDLGLLDQHLAKLALLADPGQPVTPELVTDAVGGWRVKTTWQLLDAVTEGDAVEALRQLERILQAGQPPQALLGAISWSLRRFADATRIVQQAEREGRRVDLRAALTQAGFRAWPAGAMESAERQLRQIGRHRAGELYRWLLETDLALKGTHSAPDRARLALERLIVRLSRQARPAPVH